MHNTFEHNLCQLSNLLFISLFNLNPNKFNFASLSTIFSQETDEALSLGESSKSTSTKDVIVTDTPRSRRSSYREPSPTRSRVRSEDRAPGESKQG